MTDAILKTIREKALSFTEIRKGLVPDGCNKDTKFYRDTDLAVAFRKDAEESKSAKKEMIKWIKDCSTKDTEYEKRYWQGRLHERQQHAYQASLRAKECEKK